VIRVRHEADHEREADPVLLKRYFVMIVDGDRPTPLIDSDGYVALYASKHDAQDRASEILPDDVEFDVYEWFGSLRGSRWTGAHRLEIENAIRRGMKRRGRK
jgi:hypothetical protein